MRCGNARSGYLLRERLLWVGEVSPLQARQVAVQDAPVALHLIGDEVKLDEEEGVFAHDSNTLLLVVPVVDLREQPHAEESAVLILRQERVLTRRRGRFKSAGLHRVYLV